MADSVVFRVDLKLLLELGERLISRDEVAVVELVKNSYDADAKIVEVHVNQDSLEIKDYGDGMDSSEIKEGWLTIGTRIKNRKKKTKLGRRVLGEKGIGRLAVLRLGKMITIHTKKLKNPCHKLIMNWENKRNELDDTTFMPLSGLKMELDETTTEKSKKLFPDGKGTSIFIENLNDVWDKNKIDKLKIFLSRLVEPQPKESKDFTLEFHRKGKITEIQPPQITKNPHYLLDISVDDEGWVSGEMKLKNQKKALEIESENLTTIKGRERKKIGWKSTENGGCGAFRFRLHVWDLDEDEVKGYKLILRQWSGVSLIRDDFRLVQPDVDWLGLDLRRVQNPTMRLSTNQIIGSVFITSDGNPNFIDKTDREGVIESEQLKIMKESIYYFMNILEKKRYDLRHQEPRPASFDNYLDTTPLKNIAKTLPPEQQEQVNEYASNLEKFRVMLGEWALGRDRMATMGILGAKLIHTARSALMKITDNYPLIENDLDQLGQPLKKRIQRMVKGGMMMDRIFKELDPFLKFREKRYKDVVLKEVIDALDFIFKPELDNNKIKIINTINENIVFRANPTDMYVLFSNFLDNSVYWLKHFNMPEKKIEFRTSQKNNELTIEVADNGPGIDPEYLHRIFDPGFSTKPNGTGLGLSIVSDAIEAYGGSISAGQDELLTGALFKIVIPMED